MTSSCSFTFMQVKSRLNFPTATSCAEMRLVVESSFHKRRFSGKRKLVNGACLCFVFYFLRFPPEMNTRLLRCKPPIIVASPVVSLAAIWPQTAKLKNGTLFKLLACKIVKRQTNFLLIFHTIIIPQSFPPRLMTCSSSDEKHKSWTRTLCSSCRMISHRDFQSQTMRCALNPMWLTWPEATSRPLGDTCKAEILWVWPERNSCLLFFRLRMEILFPIAKIKCSWSGWTRSGIVPEGNSATLIKGF